MAELAIVVASAALFWVGFYWIYSLTATQEECDEELEGYVIEKLMKR